MTATSNAPLYVSINPEVTADLTAKIADATTVIEFEKKKLDGYPKPTATEKRLIKSTIARMQENLDANKANLPATFIDPTVAIAFIVAEVAALDKYEAVKAEFVEYVMKNPIAAIEWRADKMIAAQFIAAQFIRPLEILRAATTIEQVIAIIEEMQSEMLKECLRRIRGASGSTSAFDNVIEAIKADTAKEMYESKLAWPLSKAKFFADAIERTAPLRNTFTSAAADLESINVL